MKHQRNLIYVKGNIKFERGYSWAKELTCFASDEWESIASDVIDGDLIVKRSHATSSYIEYAAKGGIAACGIEDGNCRFLVSPKEIIKEYRENIELLEQFGSVEMPEKFLVVKYRQLFISVISNLELFLAEIMIDLVLGFELYFKEFEEKKVEKERKLSFKKKPAQTVYDIIRGINCHRLDLVKKFFEEIFKIEVPDGIISELNEKILIRHDLVHRFDRDKRGNRQEITITEVQELINASNKLVDFLEGSIYEEIDTWKTTLPKPSTHD